jgi:hypothetical protein
LRKERQLVRKDPVSAASFNQSINIKGVEIPATLDRAYALKTHVQVFDIACVQDAGSFASGTAPSSFGYDVETR